MASNKKAQILAAVMCASSIFGSYTVVSAANTIELDNIVSSDKTSSVSAGTNTITATAGASKEQQSTISLKNGSLFISVGKKYGQNVYDGTFTLNSKNLSIASTGLTLNNNSLYVKNNNGETVGSITNSGAITGTGLTIKDGSSTGVYISKAGNIKAYDGMTITDKSSDGFTTAETKTAYNGISNKIERLDGGSNKLYSTGTTVTVNAVTTTAQGDGRNGISGNSNKTTSTVSTTSGVTDTIYDAGGSIVAKSVVSKTNIQDSFIKDGVTYSVTTNGNGTTFKGATGSTVINGGTIKASEDVKIGSTNLKAIAETVNNFGSDSGVSLVNLAGIKRNSGVTTIEGATSFNKDGMFLSKDEYGYDHDTETEVKAGYIGIKNKFGDTTFSVDHSGAINAANGKFTVDAKGNTTTKTVNGVTIETYKDTVRSANDLKNGDILIGTPDAQKDADKINLSAIDRNTAGITRNKYGTTTTIENTVKVHAPGVSHNVGTIDIYGDMIQANDPTGQRTVIKGNGITTNTVTTDTIKIGDKTIDDDFFGNIGDINTNIAGIERKEDTTIDGKVNATIIEGKTLIGSDGSFSTAGGRFTVEKDGRVSVKGSVNASGDVVTWDGNEQKYSLNTIGDTTAGISRDEETTTIEGVASFNKDGMTVNTGNSFVNVGTDNIVLNNSGNGIVIDKDGTSIIGAQGKHSINITRTGTEFLNGQDGTSTVISGGDITTDSITVAGNTIDNEFFKNMGANNAKTAGIERDGNDITGYTTSIETTFRIHSPGVSHNVGTIDIYGDTIQATTANGQKTIITGNRITTNELTVGGIKFGDLVNRVEDLEDKTQNITPSNPGTGEGGSVVPPTTGGQTGINGDVTVGGDLSVGGNLTADSATIGGVTMKDNTVTATTGNFDNIAVGGENGTTINKDGITVGKAEEGQSYTSITKDDVKVTDSQGNTTSLTDVGNRVTGLESSMNNMNNRLNDVEDRIDKVGAMAAAIANLRTMGFDPEAPTEIAIGVGQYKSETGLALGVFHYPNQDFMLSASISTSGDEVMGGIGATWKLGRKSAAEKALDAKDEEAKHLEKAEEMKKLAQDAKVKAQAERHAKLLAEREAQKTA